MHFVVSWDIGASGVEWANLDNKMREKLEPYFYACPLKTLCVVKTESQQEWDSIYSELITICKANPNEVHFIMTPLMDGGRYSGFIPENLWEKMNESVKEAHQTDKVSSGND